jgi:hypothetical protein
MTYMKTVIDGFHAAGRNEIRFAVGGAPISQMFADEIGADGYGQNASSAVDLFLRFSGLKTDEPKATGAAPGGPTAAEPAAPTVDGKRSTSKSLFWPEVPSQFRVTDDAGNDVSVELPPKFAVRIDQLAHERGFQQGDAYLAHWKWSDEEERDGSAREVAAALKAELEAKANW